MNFEELIISSIPPVPHWSFPVLSFGELPLSGNHIGEIRYVITDSTFYFWDGNIWVSIANSGSIDDGIY